MDEFIAMMKIADAFELVLLEDNFGKQVTERLNGHPLFNEADFAILSKTQARKKSMHCLKRTLLSP